LKEFLFSSYQERIYYPIQPKTQKVTMYIDIWFQTSSNKEGGELYNQLVRYEDFFFSQDVISRTSNFVFYQKARLCL